MIPNAHVIDTDIASVLYSPVRWQHAAPNIVPVYFIYTEHRTPNKNKHQEKQTQKIYITKKMKTWKQNENNPQLANNTIHHSNYCTSCT